MINTLKNQLGKLKALVLKNKILSAIICAVILIALPFIINNSYITSILVKILLYIMLASSLNVINGYSGQFNIGQAGFYAIGSYTAAIFSTRVVGNFWLALLLSGIVTAFFGYIVSFPARKLSGVYLALITLGFSEVTRLVVLNWNGFTGGPMGIKSIPRATIFGYTIKSATDFYFLGLVLTGLSVLIIYRVIHSKIGRAWLSIREDVTAAKFLGINVNAMKSLNFTFAAFIAGIAACYSTFYYQFIAPDMFIVDEGFNILAMTVIGGQGTLIGPILGAVIVNTLTEAMRFASEYRLVLYGVLIIIMMWVRPQGLAGDSNSIFAVTSKAKKKKK